MNKILFIETQATGIDSSRCAIYKMAGIICEETITGLKETKRFDYYVSPFEKARVEDKALWLGGVTRAELSLYESEGEVFKRFLTLLDNTVNVRDPKDKIYICSFSASSYDVPFLKNFFLRNGSQRFRDYFYVQTLDLMCLAAFALINEREGMPDFHLETTAKFLGVAPEHTRSYDTIVNAETSLEIFKALKIRLKQGENLYHEKAAEVDKNHK